MQTVWEHSLATGNDLLVMLAIADNANDAGVCWPAVETIAKKARCSVRTTQRIIKHLVEVMGELSIDKKAGPHQCNRYRVTLPTTLPNPAKNAGGGDNLTPPSGDNLTGCQVVMVSPEVLGGDTAMTRGGDTAMSPDPSRTVRNHHQSGGDKLTGDKLSGCQVDTTPAETTTATNEPIGSLVPSEEEVLEFCRTFQDLARGLTTIPEHYALSWFSWRCEPRAGVFPRDWKGDLRRRYVSSVLDKKTAPIRTPLKNAQSERLDALRRQVNDPRSTPQERVQARAELAEAEAASASTQPHALSPVPAGA